MKPCVKLLTLLLCGATALANGAAAGTSSKIGMDKYPAWRAAAARTLAARGDADSLATAAALLFVGSSRPKSDAAEAAALDLAARAAELAPNNPAIGWLRLRLCAAAPACDIRDAATTLRWVDADNGAAWLPLLAKAQKDRDTIEIDRILADMAQDTHFDLYGNRAAVMMFDTFRRARSQLPGKYLESDLARLSEALEITDAALIPSFSPLINACRDAATAERREACLKLSKTMQRADAVMAQLVGFAVEKRLTPTDARELRTIAEHRHLLEWRVAQANRWDAPLQQPQSRRALVRSRVAKMRALRREEDVCIAILREHRIPLDPPEDHS